MSRPKKYTIWIIILLIIGAGVYYFVQSRKPTIEYTTETAARGDLAQTVSVTGTVKAENEVDLAFQSSGTLEEVEVEIGDEVEKGQLLARIDSTDQYRAIETAKADLEAQRETLLNMNYNQSTYGKHQREAQEAVIDKAQIALQNAYQNLQKTRIYAPIKGQIIRRSGDPGENVTANAAVLAIMGEGGLEIEADVPESDIVKIKVGQRATISLDALPSDEKLESEVTKIDPASTEIQDVVYYKTKLKLANADERIKNGMSADIDIRTAEKNNVISIPLRAVKTEGDREYVEILKVQDGKEVTEKVNVKTGLKGDEGMVEIVTGLSGGEKVVTFIKTQ